MENNNIVNEPLFSVGIPDEPDRKPLSQEEITREEIRRQQVEIERSKMNDLKEEPHEPRELQSDADRRAYFSQHMDVVESSPPVQTINPQQMAEINESGSIRTEKLSSNDKVDEPDFNQIRENVAAIVEEKVKDVKDIIPNMTVEAISGDSMVVTQEVPQVSIEITAERPTVPDKQDKDVSVVDAGTFEAMERVEGNKLSNTIDIPDTFEEDQREEIQNTIKFNRNKQSVIDGIDSGNEFVSKRYEDETKDETRKITVIDSKEEAIEDKPPIEELTEEDKKQIVRLRYHGGDGEVTSFKTRSSKVSKIVKKIEIADTTKIDPVNIEKKSLEDKQKLYLNTVIPTLRPNFSVVPLLLSGVVVSMSAFVWPDIEEICEIDEEVDNLDPRSETYIQEKNRLFMKRRRKQLELFYEHIYSVSGYPTKPDIETFYRKIVKFPDFQQLFFAAYSASFNKPYDYSITCPACGKENVRRKSPKEMCFLLNKNISLDQLNNILTKGSVIATDEDSMNVYKEFQSLKLVEQCNTTYVAKKPLPDTAIVVKYKIPSIYEAYDTIDEIIEAFPKIPLEEIDEESGDQITIDSTIGMTDKMFRTRSYLYINSIQVAKPSEHGDEIKVAYVEFKDKSFIINTIKSLTPSDYKRLLNDPNLQRLTRAAGIRHGLDAGQCESEMCNGSDLGIIPVEPETLFFMIGRDELQEQDENES